MPPCKGGTPAGRTPAGCPGAKDNRRAARHRLRGEVETRDLLDGTRDTRGTRAGSPDGSGAGGKAAGPPAVASSDEEAVHILSMAERLSADLDNDLPYSAEIERLTADCEAGRSIGKTYTAEEYLRYLDHEFAAAERPAE